MKHNTYKSVKDKVSGSLHETTGKVINNKGMEYKGKFLKGRGKARELAGSVSDEFDVVKDKVVVSAQDASKYTREEIGELKKKITASKVKDQTRNAVFIGLGLVAGLYILKKVLDSKD